MRVLVACLILTLTLSAVVQLTKQVKHKRLYFIEDNGWGMRTGCLDEHGGGEAQAYPCNGGDYQKWWLEMLEMAILLFKATDQETILIPMEMEMLTPFLEMAANISNGSYRVMETINVLAIEPPVGTYLEENGLIPSKLSNPHQMAMVSSFKI